MKQISNWVFGSFFRTIGRLLVFIVLGIIIANFIDFGNIIDNFSITNLFFDKVDALTITSEVRKIRDGYFDISNADSFQTDYSFYMKETTNASTLQSWYYEFSPVLATNDGDYVTFNLLVGKPTQTTVSYTTTNDQIECRKWYCTAYSGDTCDKWQCESNGWYVVNEDKDKEYVITDYEIDSLQFFVRAHYQNNGGYANCTIQENEIMCPTNSKNISRLQIQLLWNTQQASTIKLGVSRSYNVYRTIDVQGAINNQTQQQQQQHQEIMDSNTTEADNTGKDFINNFSNNTHGLTGIITAPLNAIQSLASATCSSLVLPLPFTDNKTLTLPCMSSIYSQYFGAFYTMYQGIILALISYWVCIRIFALVKGFKDPEDDKIEVVDL